MGPVTALVGVCLEDVERGAHKGGKRLLASRLRHFSSKTMHPPNYLPVHSSRVAAPPETTAAGGAIPAHGAADVPVVAPQASIRPRCTTQTHHSR